MASYVIEFNGSGEVCEGQFNRDAEAQAWVASVLEARGYDVDELVTDDWESDGEDSVRMLYWANEAEAENDPGVNAICKLVK